VTLKTLAAAQADFRENDRDVDGERNYWRADIRGLYALKVDGRFIRLIEPSAAMADERGVTPLVEYEPAQPKSGFWLRAIRLPGETSIDPNRWAAACHPSTYGPGIRSTYVIREDGVVWRKDLGHGHGIDEYPADPKREGWILVKSGESAR
jgi:hypothetical protein